MRLKDSFHELPEPEDNFVPTTMARCVAKDIVFRPVRSWHSGTFAGERLEIVGGDKSGCMRMMDIVTTNGAYSSEMCTIPRVYTQRLYWNVKNPKKFISAILSYPDGMGSHSEYFWEIYPYKKDIKRFFGKDAEVKMERAVISILRVRK